MLKIKDLSISKELDSKALSAVVGGDGGPQANGLTQANTQVMGVVNNVGNGLVSGSGPITVQSHIDNTQTASNYAYQDNFKGLVVGFPFPIALG